MYQVLFIKKKNSQDNTLNLPSWEVHIDIMNILNYRVVENLLRQWISAPSGFSISAIQQCLINTGYYTMVHSSPPFFSSYSSGIKCIAEYFDAVTYSIFRQQESVLLVSQFVIIHFCVIFLWSIYLNRPDIHHTHAYQKFY